MTLTLKYKGPNSRTQAHNNFRHSATPQAHIFVFYILYCKLHQTTYYYVIAFIDNWN